MTEPPTIGDAARLANVSEATVSRALRGLRHVAPGTEAAVREAAEALGFVPSRSASALASGRSRLVSVVTPSVVAWFYASVLEGADDALRAAGYAVGLVNLVGADGARRRLTPRELRSGQAAAHVVIGFDLDESEGAVLRALTSPVVTVGGPVDGVRGIGIPEGEAAQLAVRHLADLGHRRIAHIGADREDGFDPGVTAARRGAWETVLAVHGVRPDPSWFAAGAFRIETARDAALRLLDRPERPTAVFAASDTGAFGVLLAAQRRGLRVPQDLSVAGIDDHPFAAAHGLTTVRQSPVQQGTRAAVVVLRDLGVRRAVPAPSPVELIVHLHRSAARCAEARVGPGGVLPRIARSARFREDDAMTTTAPETAARDVLDVPLISHWIGGGPVEPRGGRTGEVFDPARGVVSGRVALADQVDVDAAVASAVAAFPGWRDLSLARRQSVMFRFRELLVARKGELAEIITAEHGKVVSDALGEIARGIEVVEFACGLAHHLKGEFSEQVSSGVDVYSVRQPVGVVGVISPFNFPAMVPMWFFPIAIAAGNAVVLKPSEKDPSAAVWIAGLLQEAGLPDGVFTVLQGDKVAVDGLLTHPEVRSISFVGSTPIAQYIYETAARHGKRVQALGGAKNHMLVLPDADLDLVADSAVNAGFGSAGERCMAISVVVAVEPVADALIDRIRERMAGLRVGDGRRGCDMGPLVTAQHRDKVASYVDIALEDGAEVVVDGREVQVDGDPGGFWFGPTLIDRVPVSSRVYTEEIFGPVLSVVRVASYEDGVALINSGAFGNGTAIFTSDGGAARRFQREVEVGMIGINVPIPVPVATFSFGGWRQSLFGDTKAHGAEGVKFFTQQKAITSRWLDPGQRSSGVDLGFPQN